VEPTKQLSSTPIPLVDQYATNGYPDQLAVKKEVAKIYRLIGF
jgi:hypothetical protein